jgi:uncharacterized membrane protein
LQDNEKFPYTYSSNNFCISFARKLFLEKRYIVFLLKRRLLVSKLALFIFAILLISLRLSESSTVCSNFNYPTLDEDSSIIFDRHLTIIEINSIEEVYVRETIEFTNNQSTHLSSLSLWVCNTIKDIEIEDIQSRQILVFEKNNITSELTIQLYSTLVENDTAYLEVRYFIESKIFKVDFKPPYYLFQYEFYTSHRTNERDVKVRLPLNSEIHVEEDFTSYLPPTSPPLILNGFVHINWHFDNLIPSDYLMIQIAFEKPKKTHIWPYAVSPLIGLVCGVTGTLWFMRRRAAKAMKEVGEVFLSEDQFLLLELIISSDGIISQKELVKATKFTNSKISRNLAFLTEKNMITKEKWGREYKVKITDIGRKVIE